MTKKGALTKEEFRNKELDILREAVERVEKEQAMEATGAPHVKKIIAVVEAFLKKKHLI